MFQAGQKVICIKDHPDVHFNGKFAIKKDTILTIKEVHDELVVSSKRKALSFEEIQSNYDSIGREFVYVADYFAPFAEPRIVYVSVPQSIKEQIPELVMS